MGNPTYITSDKSAQTTRDWKIKQTLERRNKSFEQKALEAATDGCETTMGNLNRAFNSLGGWDSNPRVRGEETLGWGKWHAQGSNPRQSGTN